MNSETSTVMLKNETNKIIRRNGFYRQKSYNSKELSTLLKRLNFSLNLMPFNQNKTSKITSDESDNSLSDDEAFGDFEDEFEENCVSTKKNDFDKNFNQNLRKSASLSVLNTQLFCENTLDFTKQSFDNEFNKYDNSKNNLLRTTLPKTNIRSYSLNNYLNAKNKYYLKKEDKSKRCNSNINLDKKKCINTKKNIKDDSMIYNEKTFNSGYLNKVNQFEENHIAKKQSDKFYFLHDFNDIEKDCFNQINNDFNQQNHNNKQKLIECGAASSKNQTAELKISGGAKLNIDTNTAFLKDINKVNYTLTVSSCIHKPSVECSNEVSFEKSLNVNNQTEINENEYTAYKNVCDQFVDQQILNQKHFLSSESYGKKSFFHLENTNDSLLNQTNTNSFIKTPSFLYTKTDSNQKNLNENLFYLNNSQSLDKNLFSLNCVQKNSQKNFLIKSNEIFNEKSDFNNLFNQINKAKLNKSENSIISKPDLPVVFEETINPTKADCNSKDQLDIENMQTLAETQFNQLTYHIAALSCVCENNKSLANNYAKSSTFTPLSTTTNPSSSVDSSPDSSQYSSPYNSPPSSPSSVSSYSSAEEDCSILSNVNNGLKLNINQSPLAALLTVDNSKENNLIVKESDNQINLDLNNNDKVNEIMIMKISESNNKSIEDLNLNFDKNKKNVSQDSLSSDMNENIGNKKEVIHKDISSGENIVKKTVTNETNQNTNNSSNRVRKTSILRNQTPDLSNCNSSKKEVKFADTLGFALEKIKYFPPSSPQVKLKRHSVNLATMHRDYNQKHEFFSYHSRPVAENNFAKQFEEKNNINTFETKQTKTTNQQRSFSPPNQFSNNFWANFYSNQNSINLSRDEYCGDMFHQSFETNNIQPTNVARKNSSVSKPFANIIINEKTKNDLVVSIKDDNLEKSFKKNYTQVNCFSTSNQIDFPSLRYTNPLNNFSNSQQVVSFLPLNFGQPYIQSDFPNRLKSQSVLLHSLNVVNNNVNGLVSVVNLTFEKKVFIKYTLNKWVTEKVCEARYTKKDCDNSDKFVFQITLNENDFPQFQLDEDRTMMFAIRYDTGDGRTFWDNNYGQDYRLKCKFV